METLILLTTLLSIAVTAIIVSVSPKLAARLSSLDGRDDESALHDLKLFSDRSRTMYLLTIFLICAVSAAAFIWFVDYFELYNTATLVMLWLGNLSMVCVFIETVTYRKNLRLACNVLAMIAFVASFFI